MSVQCNKMPVWSKSCNGSKSGDVTTNMCYIYQKEYGNNRAWSLSPNFCTDDWMTSCQMYSRSEKYNCRSHPKNEQGLMHFEKVGWPWEEKRWKDNQNWWKTVKMTCLSESSNYIKVKFLYVAIFCQFIKSALKQIFVVRCIFVLPGMQKRWSLFEWDVLWVLP